MARSLIMFLFLTAIGCGQSFLFVPSGHPTIQSAINAASTGDTIVVAAGTYFERIDFMGKGLVIIGAGIGASILDGQGLGSVVTVQNSEPIGTRIEGFTIQNGVGTSVQVAPASAPVSFGGGIAVNGYSPTNQPAPSLEVRSCRVENCLASNAGTGTGGGLAVTIGNKVRVTNSAFVNNSCLQGGGGIFVGSTTGLSIEGCLFIGNEADFGGGVRLDNGVTAQIQGCDFIGNRAYTSGAGLKCGNASIGTTHLIQSCRFLINSFIPAGPSAPVSTAGGGLWVSGTSTRIESCVIAGNSAGQGAGIYQIGITPGGPNEYAVDSCTIVYNNASLYGGGLVALTGVRARNSIIRDNTGPDDIYAFNGFNNAIVISLKHCNLDLGRVHTNAAAVLSTAGTINLDPKFVDPLSGDFHLQLDSPCIDAGDQTLLGLPSLDLDFEARVIFAQTDMGADEAGDIALHPASAGRVGISAGGPFDVLLINGSNGGLDRRVQMPVGSAASVSMQQPPMSPGSVNFAIFGMLNIPGGQDVLTVPLGIGEMAVTPCPLLPGLMPFLFTFTNNFGPDPCGELTASSPTPWISDPGPVIPFPLNIALQGVVEESPGILFPTNLVILQVQ